jgi:hypothetical protein
MNHDVDDPLRVLEREATPPPRLKGRVVRSLKNRGLLGVTRWPVSLVAGLLLFIAGVAAGRRSLGPVADTRPSFVLLLYEGRDFRRDRPEAELRAEYGAWAASLRARGVAVRGEALDTGAHLLRGAEVQAGDAVSDQGVLAGFFIIHAADDAAAVAVTRTCPHLKYGGRIALRRVIPTS